jgi:hypothetical protein
MDEKKPPSFRLEAMGLRIKLTAKGFAIDALQQGHICDWNVVALVHRHNGVFDLLSVFLATLHTGLVA